MEKARRGTPLCRIGNLPILPICYHDAIGFNDGFMDDPGIAFVRSHLSHGCDEVIFLQRS